MHRRQHCEEPESKHTPWMAELRRQQKCTYKNSWPYKAYRKPKLIKSRSNAGYYLR